MIMFNAYDIYSKSTVYDLDERRTTTFDNNDLKHTFNGLSDYSLTISNNKYTTEYITSLDILAQAHMAAYITYRFSLE